MLADMLRPAPSMGPAMPHPLRRRSDGVRAPEQRAIPLPPRPNPAEPTPGGGTVEAAEALLYTLALPHAEDAAALVAVARELRNPLAAVVVAGSAGEVAAELHLLAVVDGLLDAASVECGTLLPVMLPTSPQALVGAVAARLAEQGMRCGRRVILQPGAPGLVTADTPRLVAALSMLATLGLRSCHGPARTEIAIDCDATETRLDLSILPKFSLGIDTEDCSHPATELPVAVARRLAALQGATLDAWTLPSGGFRARLRLRGD